MITCTFNDRQQHKESTVAETGGLRSLASLTSRQRMLLLQDQSTHRPKRFLVTRTAHLHVLLVKILLGS